MPDDRKTRWKKEIDWLLSVTDNIVEMVPKTQQTSNGIQLEVQTTNIFTFQNQTIILKSININL